MDAPLVRLSGFDAGFFYSQTPEVHQHIHVVALLDAERVGLRDGPREGHRGVLTFESFTAAVSSRLPLLPPLRHRTIRVPFALHHPVILPVLEIDTAHHFRHHDLGGAGTAENVRDLVSAIASSALDEHHPLWEMHYTEGLADGRVAVIVKLHHSLADGVAISALLEHIIATPAAFDPPQRLPEAVRVAPSRASLVREALRDLIIQLRIVPALVLRTARGMSAASRYQRVHRATVPGPLGSTPRVSFNGRLTARREFATASIPLARFRELRAQYQGQDDDVTLNDLVLGSVSGALRHWLEAHDEHPSKPLTVGIPISLDDLSLPRRTTGNQLGNVFATLATDIDDPAERLRQIATTMHHAKQIDSHRGSAMMMDWFQVVPGGPITLAVRAYAGLGLPDRLAPPFCLQVSNIPGPRTPASIGPVQISDLFVVGQLVQGNGLAVTCWSYDDRMNFALIACPDLLDDVADLASWLPDALDEYDLGTPPGWTGTRGETLTP